MPPVKVGCCGFPVARSRYYRHMDAVEVQKTFYDIVREETLRKWKREAPPGFAFTVKAIQVITHRAGSPTYRRMRTPAERFGDPSGFGGFRDTPEVWKAWEAFHDTAVRALEPEVVVFQSPPAFSEGEENLKAVLNFFRTLEENYSLSCLLGWEPRGRWSEETLRRIFRETGIIHIVDPFVRSPVTEGAHYFRLHGIGGYRYRYTPEDLAKLRGLVREGYVMFNNVHMWENALEFISLFS